MQSDHATELKTLESRLAKQLEDIVYIHSQEKLHLKDELGRAKSELKILRLEH
jgi:hypothetical protein